MCDNKDHKSIHISILGGDVPGSPCEPPCKLLVPPPSPCDALPEGVRLVLLDCPIGMAGCPRCILSRGVKKLTVGTFDGSAAADGRADGPVGPTGLTWDTLTTANTARLGDGVGSFFFLWPAFAHEPPQLVFCRC
jgi:hypothetical protein